LGNSTGILIYPLSLVPDRQQDRELTEKKVDMKRTRAELRAEIEPKQPGSILKSKVI
jgi:hypothetical protein